jgi:hypothetical protein
LELFHEEKASRNVREVTPIPRRYKKAKINIEAKNSNYLARITPVERLLLDRLTSGLEEDNQASEPLEREEMIEESPEVNKENIEQQVKDIVVENKNTTIIDPEALKTKRKKKKIRESSSMTDYLEKTPRAGRNATFPSMNPHCISPLVFSAFKKDEDCIPLFNPHILHLDHWMVSPSKLLNLNSPIPSSRLLFYDFKAPPITKQL